MANPNTPNGFRFVRRLDGSHKPPELVEYALATTNEPLAKGDLVSLMAAGSVDRTCTDDANHDHTLIIGVCESILYKDSSGHMHDGSYVGAAQGDDTKTLGNGTGGIVKVMHMTPDTVWSVQCSATGSVAITSALIGENADPLAAAATDPTQQGASGHSIQELAITGHSANTAAFKIIGLDPRVGMVYSATEANSRYGRLLVILKEGLYGVAPTAAGI